MAQLSALPFANLNYQYDSNIFALPTGSTVPLNTRTFGLGDSFLQEKAGANLLYDWSLQEFYANAEVRHLAYDDFSELNHDESLVHGGMKWKLANLFDGVLDYARERSMVPFADFVGTQLFLQRQSVITGRANVQFTPEWRLETQGQVNDLSSPRPGLPDLSLTERWVEQRLRYSPGAELSAGIDAIYLTGKFNGNEYVIAPQYSQTTFNAAMKYVPTGLSSFDGALGYTHRAPQGLASVGGTTGSLSYDWMISGRCALDAKINRSVATYVSFLGTEIDTAASLGLNWTATAKIAVTPSYRWNYTSYPEESVGAVERLDHYQVAAISVRYQILNWLSLRPYGQYETRRSDVGIYSFNRSVYGLQVEVRLSGQADQPYELSLPDW